ncbi:DegT/DnrJ/EryC1/StrS family aminotransferase [Leisingera daeponensis]|uniref:DegT/DnrJ/EryC1/StrS family aminotransferase n=1 Tax=Leisingera daeponensis TaxID=405746 RepID=A0ABS7NI29_9RHOB|nr:DegT/DnrJ/EryC1/StrS family aminotransferase [Leisingera daeponensis]MBY6140863.1 DegT/DnrJ/EryC1/StrS family aminotransferase [Leisingera daeponensis]
MNRSRVIPKSPPLRLHLRRNALPFPFGSPHTSLTRNGRFAIREGLRALGLPKGAKVLLPAWHCGSEADAVLAAGMKISLYRLQQDLSADLDDIRRQLQGGAVAAVYAIHYFGYPQPLRELQALAREHGAAVIEDVALGLFSCTPDGASLGGQGDMSVFSLVKTLPLPDGGALWLRRPCCKATDRLTAMPLRPALAGLKGVLRRGIAAPRPVADAPAHLLEAWHPRAGISETDMGGRISPFSRILLRMADSGKVRAAHRANFKTLQDNVPRHAGMHSLMPDLPAGACPAFFPLFTRNADRVHAALHAENIQSVRFWRQFHHAVDLASHPEAEALKRSVLRLPVHPGLRPQDLQRICAVLHQII